MLSQMSEQGVSKMKIHSRIGAVAAALCVAGLLSTQVASAMAQGQPPNTNPGERVVYPSAGQTSDQQASDQLACYNWSVGQTNWNPHDAYAQLEQEHNQALAQYRQSVGGGVRGAAGGALAGLAIGAIAGDAGKGAAIGAASGGVIGARRSARGRQAAQEAFEAALEEFMNEYRLWDRHWMACMEGHDYAVK
jgi:hypothetical protein